LPSLGWKKDEHGIDKESIGKPSKGSNDSESRTESMDINHILGGKRAEDILKERQALDRVEEKKKAKVDAKKLAAIKEQESEMLSQDSMISKPLDELIGGK
jgi:hypothetical protein